MCNEVKRYEQQSQGPASSSNGAILLLVSAAKVMVTHTTATAALGTEPDNLNHTVALIFFANVELVHVLTNHECITKQPPILRNAVLDRKSVV